MTVGYFHPSIRASYMITQNVFSKRQLILIGVLIVTGLSFFTMPALAFPIFQTGLEAQAGNFVVNFKDDGSCTTSGLPDYLPSGTPYAWPAEAQVAFLEAVSTWDLLLRPQYPIIINACYVDLGAGYSDLLGMAQPVSAYNNFTDAPIADTWYPVALANQLAASDLNDTDGSDHDGDGNDADAEIIVVINNYGGIDWYYGTDASPGAGQYDLMTVALHEVGHGLGFADSMLVDTGDNRCGTSQVGDGCWGLEDQNDSTIKPAIYDIFVENSSGQKLINTNVFTNPSALLGEQLVNENVFFNGTQAKLANHNNRPKLYAPNPFELPSSILHLDNATYSGTPDQLMTPIIDIGSAQHHPGPIALGMLADMGWNVAPPITITQQASSVSVMAGETLIYTLAVTNTGSGLATGIVITDVVPEYTGLVAGSLTGSEGIFSGTTPGSIITWTTGVSLSLGEMLTRTFTVLVDSGLAESVTITNTAYVSSTAGVEATSNLVVAADSPGSGTGDVKVYLPIILIE